ETSVFSGTQDIDMNDTDLLPVSVATFVLLSHETEIRDRYSKRAKAIIAEYPLKKQPVFIEADLRRAYASTSNFGHIVVPESGTNYHYTADGPKIKSLLSRITGQATFPNVVIGGKSIGGSDRMSILHESVFYRLVHISGDRIELWLDQNRNSGAMSLKPAGEAGRCRKWGLARTLGEYVSPPALGKDAMDHLLPSKWEDTIFIVLDIGVFNFPSLLEHGYKLHPLTNEARKSDEAGNLPPASQQALIIKTPPEPWRPFFDPNPSALPPRASSKADYGPNGSRRHDDHGGGPARPQSLLAPPKLFSGSCKCSSGNSNKWLGIESTLMNVLGTVLGFVISYRSSASFDRYNEGRRYWSQVVYNVRMFARTVWLHVPDGPLDGKTLHPARTEEEYRARNHVEKKTVLNLLEGFAVSLKHYLRGEEGVHYEDLFPLVRFLPAYRPRVDVEIEWPSKRRKGKPRTRVMSPPREHLTVPTSDNRARTPSIEITPSQDEKHSTPMRKGTTIVDEEAQTIHIAPSRNPPPFHIFDIWPFYLCIRSIQKRGRRLKGKRALRDRAQNRDKDTKDGVENVPLEITLYLSRYIASLQQRGLDGLTGGQMMGALSQLVDALTGLERILSTPYSVHLWTVTLVWLVVLVSPEPIWHLLDHKLTILNSLSKS
ncbi:4337_t:CDS:10, partial [Acaulospora colombiana]